MGFHERIRCGYAQFQVRRDPGGLDGGDVCPNNLGLGVLVCEVTGEVRTTYRMKAFADRKLTWPRDLTIGESSVSRKASGSRVQRTSSGAYVKRFLKTCNY